jgi:hypothetical protein
MEGWEKYEFDCYAENMIRGCPSDFNVGEYVIFSITSESSNVELLHRYEHRDIDEDDTNELASRIAECLRICKGVDTKALRSMPTGYVKSIKEK